MVIEPRVQELLTLKVIASTLNQSNELAPMLNTVLEKLLDLTGLTAGWIYLIEDGREFEFVADYGLPPAVEIDDKRTDAARHVLVPVSI
ncbi:hypothetical protein LJK88_02875 [Paenibacillus sp. P26]|nr:hypothetical protein LJK88_02875 [Paenibacillus sp. P26]